ncbi:hypothetical protein CRE_24412 [Caenorhabditis remanei]|uniref:Uncharacterized protein n=1 Tax=Caenorhabditis remanei TaxID=31234 RepID=E3MFV0_CAERE|nr:hypothetical protein CRE_24412 [Caenorhabditis remanei]
MQNFGGPPQGGMYGGSGGGPGMNQFPQPTGFSTQHHAQHKVTAENPPKKFPLKRAKDAPDFSVFGKISETSTAPAIQDL